MSGNQFDGYVQELSLDGTPGDEACIRALCMMFHRPAYVYDARGGLKQPNLPSVKAVIGQELNTNGVEPFRFSHFRGYHHDSITRTGVDLRQDNPNCVPMGLDLDVATARSPSQGVSILYKPQQVCRNSNSSKRLLTLGFSSPIGSSNRAQRLEAEAVARSISGKRPIIFR